MGNYHIKIEKHVTSVNGINVDRIMEGFTISDEQNNMFEIHKVDEVYAKDHNFIGGLGSIYSERTAENPDKPFNMDTLNTITKMLHWNKNEITYYDHNAKSFYSLKIDSGFDESKITNLNQLTYEDFDYAETGQTTHGFNIIEQTDYDF